MTRNTTTATDRFRIRTFRGDVCERNGCDMIATTAVYFHQYDEPTKACERHARWWKVNTIATRLESLGPMTLSDNPEGLTIEEAAIRNS